MAYDIKLSKSRKDLARQAFEECCSPETTVRYGVKRGRPFWNVESTQFMYVPAFHFTAIRSCRRYRYTAVDEAGGVHTFETGDCCITLRASIWSCGIAPIYVSGSFKYLATTAFSLLKSC